MLIAGAGEAGARAAIALREAGWNGRITLVGDEAHPPYERPPLSKAVMQDAADPGPTTILGPQRLRELDITLLAGRSARRIDRTAHRVQLSDGVVLDYARCCAAAAALWFHLDGQGRLLSATGVGPIGKVAREIRLAERLIAARAHPDPDALSSSEHRLKAMLRAA
ncbi:FAD-dependent oxidoreductase [Lichenicoccus sp.]|uniref:FAD-dependent oxidoreductase n=1 Tax=Lichenicoccus sp. TaxID=2781899 RepID=UPI003D0B2476